LTKKSIGYASSGTLNIQSVLQQVSARKGSTFHFGSTYESYSPNQSWITNVYQ
jgi:endo-1,4-beta-xylanase